MNKLRVLIAEDHGTVREGLRLILQSQSDIEIVGEAGDGKTALETAKQLLPDVDLTYISLPTMSGLKPTKLFRECCPEAKILALTQHDDSPDSQEMQRADT